MFLYLGFYVYKVADGHSVFVCANHELCRVCRLLFYHFHLVDVGHLGHHLIVLYVVVLADSLQRKLLFGGDILLVAHHSHTTYNLLYNFDVGVQLIVGLRRRVYFQALIHNRLALFAFGDVLPQLFGNERHEGMQHVEQRFKVAQRGVVGVAVDG